jgi:hypothetical protein
VHREYWASQRKPKAHGAKGHAAQETSKDDH